MSWIQATTLELERGRDMAPSARVIAVTAELVRAPDGAAGLCAPIVAAMPVRSGAVSTLVAPFEIETIDATDETTARLARLEVDLGEGPSWTTLADRRPVLIPDLADAATRWPMLLPAIAQAGVRALYAFPLAVGTLGIGAVDLYATETGAMGAADVADAIELAEVLSVQILHRELGRLAEGEPDAAATTSGRRAMHQATGMLVARFGVTADDALLILRAHAFGLGRGVDEVAADLVARRIEFPG